MNSKRLFPADNIAFYDDDYVGDALLVPSSRCRSQVAQIDIFEHGPWQYPTANTNISARYVIGQSDGGYHWCTEFAIHHNQQAPANALNKMAINMGLKNPKWSPASTSVNQAIKRARRCIAIQAKNIDLDTKTKIKLRTENGHEQFFDIDQIPLDRNLVYRINQKDLHRIALFNGYLSWLEFERGILDFNLA